MARRPLPRILTSGSDRITRTREMARTAADSATDVLHPLITITRGLRLLAAAGRRKWALTPKDRRGPVLFLGAACVLVVAIIPYGPLLALISMMAAAAWKGRERTPARTGPTDAEVQRLQSLYEALVPYFSVPEDPSPLFFHGGGWDKAVSAHTFDGEGRLSRLQLDYPPYFTDAEPEARARVEQLLHTKSGCGREYLFHWDQETNRLTMNVLPALSTAIAAQPFVTVPGEAVLGFTDERAQHRTMPVAEGDTTRDAPPVVWRTGARSTEPHLLAVGQPGSGTTTLLRSLALQALRHGDVLIIDGGGTGEFAALTGRAGVLSVECGPTGALAGLEWAARETERRLTAAQYARQSGHPAPEDTGRPLWILLDRPGAFAPLTDADEGTDPLTRLQVPLRHGRAAQVTVVVTEHFDSLDLLGETVWTHTRARVVLGGSTQAQVEEVLGVPPHTTPTADVPPGRGYARLGAGPVVRLQVPATPDPYDDAADKAHRHAVLDLLPQHCPAIERTPAGPPAFPERVPDQERDREPSAGPATLPAEG